MVSYKWAQTSFVTTLIPPSIMFSDPKKLQRLLDEIEEN